MSLNWREIWRDPVWSKVIATAITSLCGMALAALTSVGKKWLMFEFILPLWSIILALIFLISALIYFREQRCKEKPESVSSTHWFSEIDRQIKDCNFARIYLREFAHPDQFKPEHRESLFSFMRSLAERLESGADINIIAYHASPSEKSGVDWLKSEIKKNKKALDRVKLIRVQPVSNYSSMYLFDSGVVLYNRRLKETNFYHIENLNGSIVHFLIKRGFTVSEGELS